MIKLFLFLLTAIIPIFTAKPASAAVAFDAVGPNASGAITTGTGSFSWSHTCTGTNRLLIVAVMYGDNPDTGTVSVTYNGTAMTSISKVHSNAGTAGYVEMFYLVNPPTGANTVLVTFAFAPWSVIGGSVSFTGVNQSTPYQNLTTKTGTGTAVSMNVSSATGNMVVDAIANGASISSSGQTLRWLRNDNGSTAAGNGAQSTVAGAASVNMNYTVLNDWYGIVAVDVVAAAAATAVRHKVISD